ncbi:Ribosomal protein S18 acetylase RimI [Jatrophihabitans endophyticus]|uniref:Ribosomal protein S18 acetylase RimI n=1 Tax=Jatrophihabitans endophyticus TaxID=1206085 RepID=A0A1M5UNU3_9ACTN|nr:GNAT family N-acetyltransferase [Jatrophihabitans endophyticus]SHH64619.1 Ribosomal protein S18 acetylase RimI [Jatrophihabitans endophyticus]
MTTVRRLHPDDRAAWERLFRAYLACYERHDEPQALFDRAWAEFTADDRMHALVAEVDGRVVGLVHYLVHASTSSPDVCYLQDLFVDEDARGHGAARALIAAVADAARARHCVRVYWLTQPTNTRARRLYDQVAQDRGFMQYGLPL